MKLAIIGHGLVASVHASQLRSEKSVELVAVYGAGRPKAMEFAREYGILKVTSSIEEAVSLADAAIVCSPSSVHFQQARECLERGVHTLVEMPPCETSREARELGALAVKSGLKLQAAHTALYIEPNARISEYISSGKLGDVQFVEFVRHHKLKDRSWTDDALLHHCAHPIDMMLAWFRGLTPLGCAALPQPVGAQSVSLLGSLPAGAPVTISVTYASKLPHMRMFVVGDRHTVETDGFSYVKSDLEELNIGMGETDSYERGIHDQDMEFVRLCQGENTGLPWDEAIRLMETINHFQDLFAKSPTSTEQTAVQSIG